MHVEIITPEGTVFASEARQVLVPGSKSPFAMLDHHQAIISSLEPGRVRITLEDGSVVDIAVGANSVVEQHANRVSVIASSAVQL